MTATTPLRAAPGVPVRRRRSAGTTRPVRTLLLHGLGSSRAIWDRFVSVAPPELELWDAELPWASGGNGGWSQHGDPADWATEALRAVDGGVDLVVAHSFAANMMLELLCRTGAAEPWSRPDAAAPRAAVLVSPFYRPAADDFDWAAITFYLNDFHRILEEGIRVSAGAGLPTEVRAAMADRVRERIGPYGWMRFFDAYLRTPFLPVADLTVPLLVVSGDRDFAAQPSDGRALAAASPAGRYALVPDCGHFAMAEHPDRFAALVADFTRPLVASDVAPEPILDTHLERT
ncbi:alpha/beta fold hydrolase [Plantactinospora soyae]|uniref:Pimeloyl-ACP methyl ester carboxylesterase n=1 Tax=Plantactinospora soyae TaxID=1544732 RepID=A0A927RBS9_9ACTN|nr:alpha/beta hydrolase [Plantactinospora soyae]MBE1492001.1 pimeloyl-ACP methyl ester carboxylesterase [Plantactinospora soyae]